MSESTISVLIAVTILILLALFVPCMESLARLVRRDEQKRKTISMKQEKGAYKRDVA